MATIAELKMMYVSTVNKPDILPHHLRMFYMGKELKDDLHVYSYDMREDLTIQCLVKSNITS